MALVTKTYISKSNTIVRDDCVNLGINPVIELNYGKFLSRGLIYFDHSKVKEMVEDKIYPDLGKLHHVLKMKNVGSTEGTVMCKPCFSNYHDDMKDRACSFDLIYFLVNKDWDCGNGFDFRKDMYDKDHRGYTQDGCNWFNCKNYFEWDEDGIYSSHRLSKELDLFTSKAGNLSKVIIGYQHFENGNEDIELDITSTFNSFITGEIDNYGIGIAFAPSFEEVDTKRTEYVGFFSNHTQSFFEPYVETRYDETIEDDRSNFYLDKDNKLYFYASVGGNSVNLDELPTCTVNGVQMTSKQATKGVYYVDINISSDECDEDTMIYDVWSNIKYKGKAIRDVELSFVTKLPDGYFSFGLPKQNDETDFVPSVYGIDEQEKVKRGDIRKINIDCRIPYTTSQLRSVDGIDYRLYVMEGTAEHDVIGWTKVERGYNENYFLINTNELIPSRYYVDLRVHRDLELINHPHLLQFDIVNDVTECLI